MMANSSGKRAATLIPEFSLSDQLSSEPSLDRAIQERIGDHLRAMYDDLMPASATTWRPGSWSMSMRRPWRTTV